MMKTCLPFYLVLILAACGQSESASPPPTPASTPATASAAKSPETTAASMASAAQSEAPANDSASAPSTHLGGNLNEQSKAKWQRYACDENQQIEVRYYKSNTGPAAQIKFKGQNVSAPYSPELSDEDLSAFSNGEFTWTVSNFVQTDFYSESDGFLVRHEQIGNAGEETVVDNLLLQNCSPSAS